MSTSSITSPNRSDVLDSCTTTFPAYQPQRIFQRGEPWSANEVSDESEINAIRQAISVARRIATSPLSLGIIGHIISEPTTGSAAASRLPAISVPRAPSEAALTIVRQWFLEDRTIVTAKSPKDSRIRGKEPCGFIKVDQGKNSQVVIYLNYDLVKAAGASRRGFGVHAGYYKCAILHLAVTLCHEYVHAIRLHTIAPYGRTPAKIRTDNGQIRKVDGGILGESGWYYEQHVFGGAISRVLAVGDDRDQSWRFENQISHLIVRHLNVPKEAPLYHPLLMSTVQTIIDGDIEVSMILPLKPVNVFHNPPASLALRGWDDCCEMSEEAPDMRQPVWRVCQFGESLEDSEWECDE